MRPLKPSIGIHMPRWMYRSDESDRMFLDETVRAIRQSQRYEPLLLDLPKLPLTSEEDAQNFINDNNIALVVQHDSKFYSKNPRYGATVALLEKFVPFVNSTKCQEIGHDKVLTKNTLRMEGIPVLDDKVISRAKDLEEQLEENELYVVKPTDLGAGAGVRLIKKCKDGYRGHHNGKWRDISIGEKYLSNNRYEIVLKYRLTLRSPLLAIQKLQTDFTYRSMIVERYFNDDPEGFSSLRCTVIGDEVVEAVKRTNRKNITSNVSGGGRAKKVSLSDYRKKIAIAAKNAMGADYAGVDLLTRGAESVIGEVNIGPFTLFCKYTGVNVGKIFGEYLIKKCDALRK